MNLIPAIFRSARRASAIAIAAVVAASALLCAPSAEAKKLNDDLLNRPYADLRRFHLGFSVGLNMFGLSMHHNGFVPRGRPGLWSSPPTIPVSASPRLANCV